MKERPVSGIWSHFIKTSGPEKKAICNYCVKAISFSCGSTGNLFRHLHKVHELVTLPKLITGNISNLVSSPRNFTGKKTKPRSSGIWSHFKPSDSEEKATCNYCENTLSFVGKSTGNLFRHLQKKHKTVPLPQTNKGPLSLPMTTKEENIVVMEIPSNSLSQSENMFSEQNITFSFPKPSKFETANPSKMKERMTSSIWNHFTKISGPEKKALCNYCERTISCPGGSTGNLFRHYKIHETVTLRQTNDGNGSRLMSPTKKAPTIEETNFMDQRMDSEFSNIWDHFKRPSGSERKATCIHCQNTLSVAGKSTGNLFKHLQSKHKSVPFPQSNKGRSSLPPKDEEEKNIVVVEVSSNPLFQKESESSPPKITFSFPAPSTFEMDNQSSSPLHDYDEAPPSPSLSSSPLPSSPLPSTSPLPSSPLPSPSFFPPLLHFPIEQPDVSRFDEFEKPIPKNKRRAIDAQLTKMICNVCKECNPFSLVTDSDFKQLVKLLCPGYELPNRQTIFQTLIPSLYRTASDDLKFKLSQVTSICISCNSRISVSKTSVYSITAHYFDQNMTLHSNLIECKEFDKEHSVANISEWLDDVLINWNIKNKIVAAVTDNSTNIITAINSLSIQYISCYSHSLNLVVTNAVKGSINNVVNKVEAIVQYFKRNRIALKKFQEKRAKIHIPQAKFNSKRDLPTSWNSLFEKFNGFLRNKKSIISTLASIRFKNVSNLEIGEWDIIEQATVFLRFIEEVSKEIKAEENISLTKTCVLIRVLVGRLEEHLIETLPYEVIDFGNLLIQGLLEKFGDRENSELISQALFLDPRFKKRGFGDEERYNLTYSALAGKIQGMISSLPSQPTVRNTPPKPQVTSSSLWEEYDATTDEQYTNNSTSEETIVELNKYVAESSIHRTSDPLAWWHERKNVYPNLYEIARQRLCLPATSIPCERLIKAEQILNEKSIRITSPKMFQILFLISNTE